MTVTTTSNARRRKSMRKVLSRVILYALVALIMVWTLVPFVWLCITSISTQAKLNRIPIQWLPDPPTFEHYAAMFDPANPTGALFLAALRNSLVIAGTTTILCLLFGVLAAYALARFVFPAKNVLIMGMLATRLLPTIRLHVALLRVHRGERSILPVAGRSRRWRLPGRFAAGDPGFHLPAPAGERFDGRGCQGVGLVKGEVEKIA